MELRGELFGCRRPRRHVALFAIAIPVLATVAFELRLDEQYSLGSMAVGLALLIAAYAGWKRGGAVPGCGAVFLAVCWVFIVPPLLGYLRGSWDTRYTPPRTLGYKLDPRGELVEGLTSGPPTAIVVAVLLGGAAFLVGFGLRRIATDYGVTTPDES